MAAPGNPSSKRLMIDKAQATVAGVAAGAAFIVIFCVVASITLVGQLSYQNRVIGKKKEALATAKTDLSNVDELIASYHTFVTGSPQNIIGGNPVGTGPQDGDNAKIVLDALPSKYDFPALTTSLEKILTSQNVQIQSITGTDDEVAQDTTGCSGPPQPVEMPFEVSVSGNYNSIKNVIDAFHRSIRPFQITSLELTGSTENNMTLNIKAQTYYQPAKTLCLGTEVVK